MIHYRKGSIGLQKVMTMIANKEYERLWVNFLENYCHCYADDEGNRPCDNGVLCDWCDRLTDIWLDIISKARKDSEK